MYREASRAIDRAERKRLRTWVRRRLERGLAPEDLAEELARRGYEFEWAESFVDSVDEKLAIEIAVARRAQGNYVLGFGLCLVTGCTGFVIIFAVTRLHQTRRGAFHGAVAWLVGVVLLGLLSALASGSP